MTEDQRRIVALRRLLDSYTKDELIDYILAEAYKNGLVVRLLDVLMPGGIWKSLLVRVMETEISGLCSEDQVGMRSRNAVQERIVDKMAAKCTALRHLYTERN